MTIAQRVASMRRNMTAAQLREIAALPHNGRDKDGGLWQRLAKMALQQ